MTRLFYFFKNYENKYLKTIVSGDPYRTKYFRQQALQWIEGYKAYWFATPAEEFIGETIPASKLLKDAKTFCAQSYRTSNISEQTFGRYATQLFPHEAGYKKKIKGVMAYDFTSFKTVQSFREHLYEKDPELYKHFNMLDGENPDFDTTKKKVDDRAAAEPEADEELPSPPPTVSKKNRTSVQTNSLEDDVVYSTSWIDSDVEEEPLIDTARKVVALERNAELDAKFSTSSTHSDDDSEEEFDPNKGCYGEEHVKVIDNPLDYGLDHVEEKVKNLEV